jgi:bifunctional DNA-binding transcriptional regulator/antitoxin component of YhaV-PrlF toxin-antitoxin module
MIFGRKRFPGTRREVDAWAVHFQCLESQPTGFSRWLLSLPVAVRAALGLEAGAKVDFIAQEDGFKMVPVRHKVAALRGRFAGRVTKPVSLEAMDRAIAETVVKRHGRLP